MANKSRRKRNKSQSAGRAYQKDKEKIMESSGSPLRSQVSVSSAEQASIPGIRNPYILPELRRIGIIAGILFIVLIVLTFILG